MTDYKTKWLNQAKLDDPSGRICGHCGLKNSWCDDCGWFYMTDDPSKDTLPTCEACFKGQIGTKHREFYGCGER